MEVGFKMRKIVIIFLFIFLLSSCQSRSQSFDVNSFTEKDISVYIKNRSIQIGMNRDSVEKAIGKSIESASVNNILFERYDGVELCYRGDIVAGFSIGLSTDKETKKSCRIYRNIGLGSSYEDLIKAYGDGIKVEYNSYNYWFDTSNGNFKKLITAQELELSDKDKWVGIGFSIENNIVTLITAGYLKYLSKCE